jgi:hypothetical protein
MPKAFWSNCLSCNARSLLERSEEQRKQMKDGGDEKEFGRIVPASALRMAIRRDWENPSVDGL